MNSRSVHTIDVAAMPEERNRRAEWLAKRLMTSWLGAMVTDRDVPGGPPGLYDFDLRYRDGRTAAVEVRLCVDHVAAELDAALSQYATVEPAVGLTRCWEVRLREDTRVRGLGARVVKLLADLEAAGITGFGGPEPRSSADEIATSYHLRRTDAASETRSPPAPVRVLHEQLGVDTAWSASGAEGQPGRVVFLRRSQTASGHTEHLVTAEAERAAAAKAEVLSSPQARACGERHVFVWLDTDFCGEVEFALYTGYSAAAPAPILPECVSVVWVACWSLTSGHGTGHVIAWRAPRGEGWVTVA